jgi:hypothetical protein
LPDVAKLIVLDKGAYSAGVDVIVGVGVDDCVGVRDTDKDGVNVFVGVTV